MKALLSRQPGGPETLTLEEIPDPSPGPGEVRIGVRAVGVNFPDLLIIQDLYQINPPRPFSPGGELAGIVEVLGDGVANLKVGDRVLVSPARSAMAEKAIAHAGNCWKIPDSMPFDDAAALLMTYGTSQHALKDRANLRVGETLLVLGAGGGVGLAAVEIGKAMGARVIAGASSEEKLAFARRYGAAETINTASDDMRARLKALAPKGVDVVYDPVGGALTEAALRSLAWKGRLLVIGFASGEIPRPPLNIPLLKGCDIRGVYWGEFTGREPEAHRENVAQLMEWAKSGVLSVHVHATYPLEEYRKAFEAIAKRQVLGKTLLQLAAAAG